jgi:hypothetical protein
MSHLTPWRRALLALLVPSALLALVPALAAAEPMTAADEPPVIANAGVKAGAEPQSQEDFEVELGFSLICPSGAPLYASVAFTDANGETTEHLSHPCRGEWAESTTTTPDVLAEWSINSFPGFPPILAGEAGMPPYVLFSPPPDASGPHPFLYQVTDASGVIAQAPITAQTTPEQRISEGSTAFQQDCAAPGDVKREANGSGYCILPASTKYYAGWPAAPPARTVVLLCASSHMTTRVPRVKPTRCNTLGPHQPLADVANLADLTWRGWGEAEASATGVELGDHRPAAHLAASVRAYGLEDCDEDEARYTRLRVHDRSGTRVLGLPGCPTT